MLPKQKRKEEKREKEEGREKEERIEKRKLLKEERIIIIKKKTLALYCFLYSLFTVCTPEQLTNEINKIYGIAGNNGYKDYGYTINKLSMSMENKKKKIFNE